MMTKLGPNNACLFFLLFLLGPMGLSRAAPPMELPPPLLLPKVLSLDESLRLFRSHGLDLLIAEANVRSASADLRLAGAVQNPTVNASFLKSFNYNPSDPSICAQGAGCSDLGYAVGLSDQALWDVMTGKRGLRLKIARAALEAAQLGRKDAERILSFQVKQQFVQVALAQQSFDFTHEVADAAGQTAELNRKRYKAGAISEVDLAKAQAEYFEAQQAVDSAMASLKVQRVGLAFLLGARGPVTEFNVDLNLTRIEPEGAAGRMDPPSLIAEALRRRPDLAAQAAQRERALAGLDAAYRQRVPDGALSIQYTQQGTGPGAIQPPTLTVGVQLALPLFNQNQGGIEKSRVDVFQQAAQYAKLQSQVVSDIEQSYTTLDLNRRLISRYEMGLLGQARLTRDLQRLRYEKGAASLLEYLDAQRVYIASYKAYFQALANFWIARFALEQAIGT